MIYVVPLKGKKKSSIIIKKENDIYHLSATKYKPARPIKISK